jgi:hypothetical protein
MTMKPETSWTVALAPGLCAVTAISESVGMF